MMSGTSAAGKGNGSGRNGDRSSLFYYVHLATWVLIQKVGRANVRFIVENAGSMQDGHSSLQALGLMVQGDQTADAKRRRRLGPADQPIIKRNRYFFSDIAQRDIPCMPDITFNEQATVLYGKAVPMKPLLRTIHLVTHHTPTIIDIFMNKCWTSHDGLLLVRGCP